MAPRNQRSPLYSQIRDFVLANLQQRIWRANDQLPTELELAEKFNVSRFTVKKALGELVEEGLIYRIQGKGSYVAPAAGEREPSFSLPDIGSIPLKQAVYVTPDIESGLSARILAGAEEILSRYGWQLIIKSSRNERETERRLLLESVQAGARGVMIFPVDGESYNEDILRLTLNKFPIVVIDRYLKGVDTNCVCSDNAGGAYEATAHLIGLGHRHIGYIAMHGSPTTSLEERQGGYERALADHRLPIGPTLVHYATDEVRRTNETDAVLLDPFAVHAESIRVFLQRHPEVTAIFAATTHGGMAAMQAAADLGLQVPGQLSVVFFDDFAYSPFSRIPPTCIVQQETELGTEAAKLLLSVIGNPLQERRKITLPTRLVRRQSTAPPPDKRR